MRRWLDDCATVVRRAYQAATKRPAVRDRLHARGRDHQLDKARSAAYADRAALMTLLEQMARLAMAGAQLNELLVFSETLREKAFELAGPTPRSLDQLDLEEAKLDGHEDLQQIRRRVHGKTPVALLEEAETALAIAAINLERARACRIAAAGLAAQERAS
jgi:hypothetical protein